jgi:hypothetical protein
MIAHTNQIVHYLEVFGLKRFDPPQLRLGGDWNHLMPKLTPEPDSTDGKNKNKKNKYLV